LYSLMVIGSKYCRRRQAMKRGRLFRHNGNTSLPRAADSFAPTQN